MVDLLPTSTCCSLPTIMPWHWWRRTSYSRQDTKHKGVFRVYYQYRLYHHFDAAAPQKGLGNVMPECLPFSLFSQQDR